MSESKRNQSVDLDAVMHAALKLIEKKSRGLIRLGSYQIWTVDGMQYQMKPKEPFRKWVKRKQEELLASEGWEK